MQMHIRHETRYRYERPVKYSVQSLHLTPRRDLSQRALTWTITAPGRRLEQVDAHGNIWVLSRPRLVIPNLNDPPDAESGVPAPSVFAWRRASSQPCFWKEAASTSKPRDVIAKVAMRAMAATRYLRSILPPDPFQT